jgi:hypothetical protein
VLKAQAHSWGANHPESWSKHSQEEARCGCKRGAKPQAHEQGLQKKVAKLGGWMFEIGAQAFKGERECDRFASKGCASSLGDLTFCLKQRLLLLSEKSAKPSILGTEVAEAMKQ